MKELLAALSMGFGGYLFILFIICSIIVPVSIYAAQKWTYRCYKELCKLNKNIEKLIEKEVRQ